VTGGGNKDKEGEGWRKKKKPERGSAPSLKETVMSKGRGGGPHCWPTAWLTTPPPLFRDKTKRTNWALGRRCSSKGRQRQKHWTRKKQRVRDFPLEGLKGGGGACVKGDEARAKLGHLGSASHNVCLAQPPAGAAPPFRRGSQSAHGAWQIAISDPQCSPGCPKAAAAPSPTPQQPPRPGLIKPVISIQD
jgi:hypothetical protein